MVDNNMNVPNAVLRVMTTLDRSCFGLNSPALLRRMQETDFLTLTMVKYADDQTRDLGLGFAVQFIDKQTCQLASCDWIAQMSNWDSLHWAWFIALTLAPLCKVINYRIKTT